MVGKITYKKLNIDVVVELHAIRKHLEKLPQDKILKEAESVRKVITQAKTKKR